MAIRYLRLVKKNVMNRIYIIFLLSSALVGCKVSSELDPNGIKLETKVLDVTDHYLSAGEGKVSSHEFITGTRLYFIMVGVKGFAIRNEKANPGCSMIVTDREGNKIMELPDLFSENVSGIDPSLIASQLKLTLAIGKPIEEGRDYNWKVRVWDKNGNGEIMADIPLRIVKPRDMAGIRTTTSGLDCPTIYISDNGPIASNRVKMGQRLYFVFSGLSGWQVQDSTVRIGVSMLVKNKAGSKVLEYENLFAHLGPVKLKDASLVKADLSIGAPIHGGQTYEWTVRVWDKSSNKSLESTADIIVQ
jgi:hypothetical protein